MARNKRHRRGEGGAIGPILAILAIVVMVGGTGAFFFWSYSRSQGPEIDEVSLCPKTGPTAHLAILVDTTDPISLTQLEAARQQIERKIAEAAVHTRISFATVICTSSDNLGRLIGFRIGGSGSPWVDLMRFQFRGASAA